MNISTTLDRQTPAASQLGTRTMSISPLSVLLLTSLLLTAAPGWAAEEIESAGQQFNLILDGGFASASNGCWVASSSSAKVKIVTFATGTNSSRNCLQLEVGGIGCGNGVKYVPINGIAVGNNASYDLVFRARTERRDNDRGYGLTITLGSRDGKLVCGRTTLPEVGGEWSEYRVAVRTRAATADAVLTITMSEPGTIWFENVQLNRRAESTPAQ